MRWESTHQVHHTIDLKTFNEANNADLKGGGGARVFPAVAKLIAGVWQDLAEAPHPVVVVVVAICLFLVL